MIIKHQLIYYVSQSHQNPVKDFINSLQLSQKSKIFRTLRHFEEYGLQAIIPHTKKLAGTPLWEIRILGKDNIRILYVSWQKEHILVLHGFLKKKQKTPVQDIKIALGRLKDWNQKA
ncbi:MAG: type II toxin-antitoxin system RelE/ParE family toxin [Patescibacteria group bacterium]